MLSVCTFSLEVADKAFGFTDVEGDSHNFNVGWEFWVETWITCSAEVLRGATRWWSWWLWRSNDLVFPSEKRVAAWETRGENPLHSLEHVDFCFFPQGLKLLTPSSWLPSGNFTVCYWTWPSRRFVSFPRRRIVISTNLNHSFLQRYYQRTIPWGWILEILMNQISLVWPLQGTHCQWWLHKWCHQRALAALEPQWTGWFFEIYL